MEKKLFFRVFIEVTNEAGQASLLFGCKGRKKILPIGGAPNEAEDAVIFFQKPDLADFGRNVIQRELGERVIGLPPVALDQIEFLHKVDSELETTLYFKMKVKVDVRRLQKSGTSRYSGLDVIQVGRAEEIISRLQFDNHQEGVRKILLPSRQNQR